MNIKTPSKIQLTATTIISGLLYLTPLSAAGIDNLVGIKKDISVISKVLESSTELEGSRSKISVSGNYLAKQGIVLKIHFPGTSRFDFNFDGFGSIVTAPVIPDIPGVFSEDELQEIIEDAMETARETMAEMPGIPVPPEIDFSGFPSSASEESIALRKQQRELRKQQRELEKKVREIEKQARKQSGKKELKLLQKKQGELKAIRDKIKLKAQQMKQQVTQVKKKQQQKRAAMLNTWTNSLAENFCSYAPYPRNLPKDEFLTLIISDAVYRESKLEDKIIVINNRQLISCRDGKSDGKALLSKSLSYSF